MTTYRQGVWPHRGQRAGVLPALAASVAPAGDSTDAGSQARRNTQARPDAVEAAVAELAAQDLEHRILTEAGVLSMAEIEAYRAARAAHIAQLDQTRGDAYVTYAHFHRALNNGAACDVLHALRTRMHPLDPLRAAATRKLLLKYAGPAGGTRPPRRAPARRSASTHGI